MQSAYLLLPSGAWLLPLAPDPVNSLQSRASWPGACCDQLATRAALQAVDYCRRSLLSLGRRYRQVGLGRRYHLRSHQSPAGQRCQQQSVEPCAGFQGKSIAMAVESRVIQALRDEGFALISDHDARTQRSPHVA